MAVRLWPAQAYTRVTLESDKPLVARHFITEAPERLVIDIDGLTLSPRLKELVAKLQANDPFIASVRVGQYQPRVVRLVLDLKQSIAPQVFTLAPVAAYQHRLVLDLYPALAPRTRCWRWCRSARRMPPQPLPRSMTNWGSGSRSCRKKTPAHPPCPRLLRRHRRLLRQPPHQRHRQHLPCRPPLPRRPGLPPMRRAGAHGSNA